MPAKVQATKVLATPTMAAFLYDACQERIRQVKLEERRRYSQNDFAALDIGMNPQTFSRYVNGDTNMTMDQAVILIKYFRADILSHFVYGSESSLTRQDAELLALASEDDDIGRALAALARMQPDQRKAAAQIILNYAEGGEATQLDLSTV